MKLLCLAGLGMLLLTGCYHTNAVGKSTTDNREIQVEILFRDADGYTVKRFEDRTNGIHYYVTPGPARLETRYSRTVSNGKTSTTTYHTQAIETAGR